MTTEPRVYNKRHKNYPDDAIYVGRPSLFGNPFSIEVYGREQAIEMYRQWIKRPEQTHIRLKAMEELKGKNLLCWCKPLACHADILLDIASAE